MSEKAMEQTQTARTGRILRIENLHCQCRECKAEFIVPPEAARLQSLCPNCKCEWGEAVQQTYIAARALNALLPKANVDVRLELVTGGADGD